MSDPKARKKATKNSPYCRNTINKIIKEKFLFGNLVDGPSPRSTLSIFDKLSCEQKDKIRKTVSCMWKSKHFSFTQCYVYKCLQIIILIHLGALNFDLGTVSTVWKNEEFTLTFGNFITFKIVKKLWDQISVIYTITFKL